MPILSVLPASARRVVTAALVGVSLAACVTPKVRTVKYPLQENGRTTKVEKFFITDGLTRSPENEAFEASQRGDFAKGIEILKGELRRWPRKPALHYDIGILYEVTGDWQAAEDAMQEAVRHAEGKYQADRRREYEAELAFIQRHRRAIATTR